MRYSKYTQRSRMGIPLLEHPLSTQNSRVTDLAGDNSTIQLQSYGSIAAGDNGTRTVMDGLIERAYRQIFFHAMSCDRDSNLESQLRSKNITVRDFIRGLLLSERFQQGYYQCNSNYRMVDQVVGRVLGRPVHGDAERRSWAILIGEKGFTRFVDEILESNEYMDSFGYDLVPQQRSRILPGKGIGELPIYQKYPRYGKEWRDSLQMRAPSAQRKLALEAPAEMSAKWVNGNVPKFALRIWLTLIVAGGIEITRLLITIAVSMLRT